MSQYHAPFVVVLWDVNLWADDDSKWVREKLQEAGIPMLVLSAAIPDLQSDRYYIPGDGHPNGKALTLVARALNEFLDQHVLRGISHRSIAQP